jgi:hypothetical protein
MAPVNRGPSTRFDAVAAIRTTAVSIFAKPGAQSVAGPRCRHDWNNRPCRDLQTLSAMFARLGRSRSIVPRYPHSCAIDKFTNR